MSIICPYCGHTGELDKKIKKGEKYEFICNECGKKVIIRNILSLRSEECREVVELIVSPLAQVMANLSVVVGNLKERASEEKNIVFFETVGTFLVAAQNELISHIQIQCYKSIYRILEKNQLK